ncbi:hypothetical protein AB0H71_13810 [Nocardia sp. NPDC050697]
MPVSAAHPSARAALRRAAGADLGVHAAEYAQESHRMAEAPYQRGGWL